MAKNLGDYSEKDLNDLIKGIFAGTITPSKLPEDLFEAILDILADAVLRGFGGSLEIEEAGLNKHFERNIAVFSAAKTHQQVIDMSLKLLDDDGGKVSFSQFKKEASKIFEQYNVNWLETEYATAHNNAFAASQWLEFEKDKDFAPLLRYDTVGDERVRSDHEALDGIVRHIDDPFWNTHFPPNDWNCRCDVTAHAEDEVEVTPDDGLKGLPDPDELFAFNPAKDKQIFDLHNHPYLKVADRYKVLKEEDFGLDLPEDPNK